MIRLKKQKFTVWVPKFGFRAFILAVGLLWLVSLLAGYLAQVSTSLDAPAWATAGLRLLSYVVGAVLTLLILYRLWGVMVRLGLFLWSLVSETERVDLDLEGDLDEAPEIGHVVHNLAQILDQIEDDSHQAELLLADAELYTATLVDLIQAIALRAETMLEESQGLSGALEAIATNDPVRIAMAAGAIKDDHIRTLMLSSVQNSDYWQAVARLVAVQLGTVQQWEQGYRKFTTNLLGEVSQAKSRLAALHASNDLVGTSRPLLQIQANLKEAGGYLQLQQNPGLYQAARSLPSVHTGLLR